MTASTTSTQGLLLRAATYQALATGYDYPDASQRDRMQALLDDLGWATEQTDHRSIPALDRLAHALAASPIAEVEADFNRLFSGEVTCTPHESAYEPDVFRRQRSLADIAGFHAAFGFELPGDSRWQPDHIGVELELCAVLLQRQAHALQRGWDEPTEVCEQALRAFLTDHLGRWYAAFAQRLVRLAASPFYRELARATDAWVRQELARWRLRPEPLADRPRTVEDDTPPACGACPAVPSVT